MNLIQLKSKLNYERVDPSSYFLKGGLPNEAFCLGNINGIWEVYYSERGNKTSLKTFNVEEEACLYFYNWLKSMI